MVAKANQELKRERKRVKRERIDTVTNRYMINLAWGIFVIILLRFVEAGYMSIDTVLQMPALMKTMAVIFAIGGIALAVCGKLDVAGKKDRFWRYAWFVIVLAVGSLWIGFYSDIRNAFVQLNPRLMSIDSRWWISRSLIVLVVAYLIIMLVWTTIKITIIEKGKKN
jgi:hypothetical protein